MTCAMGGQAIMLVDSAVPWDANSERYEFIYETMKKSGRIIGGRGIVGSRSQPIERTRSGSYGVGGRVSMHANPVDLDAWLPRILGGSESADSFPLTETLPVFEMFINKVGGSLEYTTCYVDRAIFRSRAGPTESEAEMVEMILEIVCKDEDPNESWPGTIATLSTATNRAPYIHSEGVLNVNSSAYPYRSWALVIDNHIHRRWTNSLTATELCPGDRTVMLRTENPFTATEFAGLYDLSASETGVAGSVVLTNGSFSTTFTMAGLQWADNSPTVMGKQEIPLTLDFYARMKGTDRELVVTNVPA